MTNRELVPFNITRADIPPLEGFDHMRETPVARNMAHEDLRITNHGDDAKFLQVLILGCQMLEAANPGKLAAMIDHETVDGHVKALTLTVI